MVLDMYKLAIIYKQNKRVFSEYVDLPRITHECSKAYFQWGPGMHRCFALGGHFCGRKPEHPEKTHVSEWATKHTLSYTTTADHGDRTRAALVRSQCATRTPRWLASGHLLDLFWKFCVLDIEKLIDLIICCESNRHGYLYDFSVFCTATDFVTKIYLAFLHSENTEFGNAAVCI
jgi:hypothetical protein